MKQNYKNILLAIELSKNEEELKIAQRAVDIAASCDANLFVIHAIEHINSNGIVYGEIIGVEIEEKLFEKATENMKKFIEKTGISKENQQIKFGYPKTVILEKANEINADLIVIGSHGRRGVQLLLGSTANAILHKAKCDVLAVRV